jgi:hypothetical protein
MGQGNMVVILLFVMFYFLDGLGLILFVGLFGDVFGTGGVKFLVFGCSLTVLPAGGNIFRLSSASFAFKI